MMLRCIGVRDDNTDFFMLLLEMQHKDRSMSGPIKGGYITFENTKDILRQNFFDNINGNYYVLD